MTLPFADVLNALDQLATVSTSHTHQLALQAAIEAVHFKHAIEATIERHYQGGAQPLKIFQVSGDWSADEDMQLRQEFEAGLTLDIIAARHRRAPMVIAERLRDLHILSEQAVEEIRTARARQSAKFDYETQAEAVAAIEEVSHPAEPVVETVTAPAPVLEEPTSVSVPAPAPVAPTPAPASASAPTPMEPAAVEQEKVAPAVVDAVPEASAETTPPWDAPQASAATPDAVAAAAEPTAAPEPAAVATPVATQEQPVSEEDLLANDPLADLFDTTPPAMLESDFVQPAVQPEQAEPATATPETTVSEAAPAAEPAQAPAAPAPVASTPAAAPAVKADGKPEMTPVEEKTVNEVLAKYKSKNAPKNTLRAYVATDKFGSKVTPAVQAWLIAELDRLG